MKASLLISAETPAETPPVAAFSGTPTTGALLLTVVFTDESTGEITDWHWTFGEGGESTEQHPSHTYNTVGTYTVSLQVTGPYGTDTETKTGYITTVILLQLREHKSLADWTPIFTFTAVGTPSKVDIHSTDLSIGDAYLFIVFPKTVVEASDVYWKWACLPNPYYSNASFGVYFYDGAYDRASEVDFPEGQQGPTLKGMGLLQTLRFRTGEEDTSSYLIRTNVSASTQDYVTLFFLVRDGWTSYSVDFLLLDIEIRTVGTGVVIWDWNFAGSITMEKTGTTGDYGLADQS